MFHDHTLPSESLAVARAEEARQAAGVGALVRAMRDEDPEGPNWVEQLDSGVMTVGPPGVWWNQAVGLGMGRGPVSDETLDRLVAFYRERGIEPRAEVASVAHESLLKGLATRGFGLRSFEHVLARRMQPAAANEFAETWSHPLPAETYDVARLASDDEAGLKDAARVFTVGFWPDLAEDSEAFRRRFRETATIVRTMHSLPECASFVARRRADGEIVGFASCDFYEGVCGFFAGVVACEARRQGVHAMLFLARLQHARESGAQWVTVGSDPGGRTERNAGRFGFRLAFTKAVLAMPGEGLAPSP